MRLRHAWPVLCAELLISGLLLAGCSIKDQVPVFGPGQSPWLSPDLRWRIESPLTGAEQALAAQLLPDDEAWIVGTRGLIMHHAGGAWTREESGTDVSLAAVLAQGGEVFAAGAGGTVLRRVGGTWAREQTGTDAALVALAATSDGAIWAAGAGATLLRRGPAGWTPALTGGPPDLTCLAAVGDTLFVGCSNGDVLAWSGGTRRGAGSLAPLGVTALAAAPTGELFASDGRSLFRRSASGWTRLRSIGGTGPIAAGDSLLVYCGGSTPSSTSYAGGWRNRIPEFPVYCRVVAMGMTAGPRILAVSDEGLIAWLRDGAWTVDMAGRSPAGLARLGGTFVTAWSDTLYALGPAGWRGAVPLPPNPDWSDSYTTLHLAGASLADFYLYIPRGDRFLRWREGWTELSPHGCDQMALDPGGDLLINIDELGIYRLSGGDWVMELPAIPATPAPRVLWWSLQRDASGTVIAHTLERLCVRRDGRWSAPDSVEIPGGTGWTYAIQIAGVYPDKFALIDPEADVWLPWDPTRTVRQEGWIPYDFPEGITRHILSIATGTREIVVSTGYPSAVLWLKWDRPAAPVWTVIAGPVADTIGGLRVEADGSLTGIGSGNRIYRYPAPANFRP